MLFPKGLAVSLPSHHFRRAALPSSVFDLHALEQVDLGADLRAAVLLVAGFCDLLGCRLVFIHRPEIFTHGETLSWLTAKLDSIGDHLNISDGTTVKLLPGMRNHLFLYLQKRYGNVNAFEQFNARAPETLCQIEYQINTTFSFMRDRILHRPQTLLIQAEHYRIAEPPEFRHFYLNHHSAVDSAARSMTLAASADAIKEASHVLFIAFTNNAVNDVLFCRVAAEAIVKGLGLSKKHLLVLGAPPPQVENEQFSARAARLFDGLIRSGIKLPRAVLSNTLIASVIPDEPMLTTTMGNLALVIPDSFDAWSYPRSFWAMLSKVTLVVPRFRRRDKAPIMTLLTDIMGGPPELVWTAAKEHGSLYSKVKDD